jgi:hypothetical protein
LGVTTTGSESFQGEMQSETGVRGLRGWRLRRLFPYSGVFGRGRIGKMNYIILFLIIFLVIIVVFLQLFFKRKVLALSVLSCAILSGAVLIYYAIFNPIGETKFIPFALGGLIIGVGGTFYFRYRSGFDLDIDFAPINEKQFEGKIDEEGFDALRPELEEIVKGINIEIDWGEYYVKIPSTNDKGISVGLVMLSENTIITLNDYVIYYNHYTCGKEKAIDAGLFLFTYALSSKFRLRVFNGVSETIAIGELNIEGEWQPMGKKDYRNILEKNTEITYSNSYVDLN